MKNEVLMKGGNRLKNINNEIVESNVLYLQVEDKYFLKLSDCRVDSKGIFEDLPLLEVIDILTGKSILNIWMSVVLNRILDGFYDDHPKGFTDEEYSVLKEVLIPMKQIIFEAQKYFLPKNDE